MNKQLESKSERLEYQRRYWAGKVNARRFDHPIVKFFGAQRVKYLSTRLDLAAVSSAFEIGAGDGFATSHMMGIVPRLYVSDISSLMLACNPAPSGTKVQAIGEQIPLRDGSVDLVFCWEVLHHVSDVTRTLAEATRITRKYVVFFEPNRNHPAQFAFSMMKKAERGGLKFSKRYCRELCANVGLDVLSLDVVGCIFPNMCPVWLFPILRRLPFVQPYTGISIAVIARKKCGAGSERDSAGE